MRKGAEERLTDSAGRHIGFGDEIRIRAERAHNQLPNKAAFHIVSIIAPQVGRFLRDSIYNPWDHPERLEDLYNWLNTCVDDQRPRADPRVYTDLQHHTPLEAYAYGSVRPR